MANEMTNSEKGLIWTAFVFAVMASSMVVLPYLATWVFANLSNNAELGGSAFGMTFGLLMIAFGVFSWVGSCMMLAVNVITNRNALRSKMGVATCIMDIGVLSYAIFFALAIF